MEGKVGKGGKEEQRRRRREGRVNRAEEWRIMGGRKEREDGRKE